MHINSHCAEIQHFDYFDFICDKCNNSSKGSEKCSIYNIISVFNSLRKLLLGTQRASKKGQELASVAPRSEASGCHKWNQGLLLKLMHQLGLGLGLGLGTKRTTVRCCERAGERVGERVDERVGERVGERAGERAGERVGDRVGDRVGERGFVASPEKSQITATITGHLTQLVVRARSGISKGSKHGEKCAVNRECVLAGDRRMHAMAAE